MVKKFLAVTLALVLASGFAAVASANVDLGFMQDTTNTSLRFDYQSFLFEVPLDSEITEMSVGGKLPIALGNSYGLTELTFTAPAGDEPMGFGALGFGLGYPIEFGSVKIRAEMVVASPEWQAFEDWTFEPSIGIQFGFSGLDEAIE